MDGIQAVQLMQNYIHAHHEDTSFNADIVCSSVGYSRRHGDRIFKKYLGRTIQEYINAVCLTQSANDLLNTPKTITEIAFDSHFESHEGFSRSFYRRFRITPSAYRNEKIAIPLFVQYPISHYYSLFKQKEDITMDTTLSFCTVTAKERTRRKLIYLPSRNAQDYMSYCEEVGCEWEGLLNSILEKLDVAALVELPDSLVEAGFSKIGAGIEVPLDYDKPIPASYKIAELPECTMLYFQSEPYESEENFCKAIENTYAAIANYSPSVYGYEFACDIAPSFNFGAEAKYGARMAMPATPVG